MRRYQQVAVLLVVLGSVWLNACQSGSDKNPRQPDALTLVETLEDTPVTFKPYADASRLQAISYLQSPQHGELTNHHDGSYTYTPAGGFNGEDYMMIVLASGQISDITLKVTAVNNAPLALDDVVVTRTGQVLLLEPLANDLDVDSTELSLVSVDGARNGTLTRDAGNYSYTPAPDFIGTEELTYTVSDGAAQAQGQIHVFVFAPQVFITRVQIEPAPAQITLDDKLALSAYAVLSNDMRIEVSQAASWHSADAGIAGFDDDTKKNAVHGLALGQTDIRVNYREFSASIALTVIGHVPAQPKGLTALPGAESVQLDWKAVNGANYYNLYYQVGGKNAAVVPHVTAPYNHAPLDANATLRYYVTALNEFGESTASEQAIATPLAKTAVMNAVISTTPGQILLNWASQDGLRYQIIWANRLLFNATDAGAHLADPASSPFQQTDLQHQTVYYYVLRALDANNRVAGEQILSALFERAPPAAPAISAMTPGDGQLELQFDTQTGLRYQLLWLQGDSFDALASQTLQNVTSPYVHRDLTAGLRYTYALRVQDGDGLWSALSIPLSGVPLGAAETVAANSRASIAPTQNPVTAGSPITLTVIANDAGGNRRGTGGDLAALDIQGANAAAGVQSTDHGDGSYSLTYTATVAGDDGYFIALNQQIIGGGPYGKTIVAAAARLDRTVMRIPAGPYARGDSKIFAVQLFDEFNNTARGSVVFRVTGANAGDITASFNGASQQYEASFLAQLPGNDTITVSVDGVTVDGVSEIRDTLDNQSPMADAGEDFVAAVNVPLHLDATQSRDPENDALNYSWRIISAPGAVPVINTPDAATAGFTPAESGNYDIQLTVSDAFHSITDTVRAVVRTPTKISTNTQSPVDRHAKAVNARGDVMAVWSRNSDGGVQSHYAIKPVNSTWGAERAFPEPTVIPYNTSSATPIGTALMAINNDFWLASSNATGDILRYDNATSQWIKEASATGYPQDALIAGNTEVVVVASKSSYNHYFITLTRDAIAGVWNRTSNVIGSNVYGALRMAAQSGVNTIALVWYDSAPVANNAGGNTMVPTLNAAMLEWNVTDGAWQWQPTVILAQDSTLTGQTPLLARVGDHFLAAWEANNHVYASSYAPDNLGIRAWSAPMQLDDNINLSYNLRLAAAADRYLAVWTSQSAAGDLFLRSRMCQPAAIAATCWDNFAVQSVPAPNAVHDSALTSDGQGFAAVLRSSNVLYANVFRDTGANNWQWQTNAGILQDAVTGTTINFLDIQSNGSTFAAGWGRTPFSGTYTDYYGAFFQVDQANGITVTNVQPVAAGVSGYIYVRPIIAPSGTVYDWSWIQDKPLSGVDLYALELNGATSNAAPVRLSVTQLNGSVNYDFVVKGNQFGELLAVWQQVNNLARPFYGRFYANGSWGPVFQITPEVLHFKGVQSNDTDFMVFYTLREGGDNLYAASIMRADPTTIATQQLGAVQTTGYHVATAANSAQFAAVWKSSSGVSASVATFNGAAGSWQWQTATPLASESGIGLDVHLTGSESGFAASWETGTAPAINIMTSQTRMNSPNATQWSPAAAITTTDTPTYYNLDLSSGPSGHIMAWVTANKFNTAVYLDSTQTWQVSTLGDTPAGNIYSGHLAAANNVFAAQWQTGSGVQSALYELINNVASWNATTMLNNCRIGNVLVRPDGLVFPCGYQLKWYQSGNNQAGTWNTIPVPFNVYAQGGTMAGNNWVLVGDYANSQALTSYRGGRWSVPQSLKPASLYQSVALSATAANAAASWIQPNADNTVNEAYIIENILP